MAEASSLRNARGVRILAPPSLTSCIDIVDRTTAPCHNDRPMRGAIISFDFTYSSNLFFVQKESAPKFNLNFTIQIEEEYHVPIEIQAVEANHFNLENNMAELLNDSKKFPTLKFEPPKGGAVEAQMCPPINYGNWGDNYVRFMVLSNVYPSNINVSVSLSTIDGTHQLRRAFTGASRPYTASSPNEKKLRELLCWTAGLGYIELFKAYLDQLPLGIEMEDAFGMTPFSWAARNGWAPVVRLALQQTGSICARRRTTRGPAPLEAAARSKDEIIFILFLKWLKYLENPIAIAATTESDEIPEVVPDLNDDDIEREIQSAVRNEQTVTIRKLVEYLRDRQGGQAQQDKWLTAKIVKAAEEGDLYLVQALKSCGADVNCEDENKMTPLMGAITKRKAKVAKYLIFQGATDSQNHALLTAVMNKQHSTIRALLQVKTLMEGESKEELTRIAKNNKDSTTLMLLKLEKGTETLATHNDLHPHVDRLFQATVADFSEDQPPKFTELSVHKLMHKDQDFFDLTDESKFKWFHLPANNMKWAEALISKIYYRDPSLAYKVLEQKRWMKRQHEGKDGSSHARFMMSACHDFQEAFKSKKKIAYQNGDRHVVLFMPYLYWDEEMAMKRRSNFLAPSSRKVSPPSSIAMPSTKDSAGESLSSTVILPVNGSQDALLSNDKTKNDKSTLKELSKRESLLLEKYLLSESDFNKSSRHVLHVRRTLDQSLYHNLKDTTVRDGDQTVHRYQEKLNEGKRPDEVGEFAVIMVDQLWLWILLGPSGKAQAVVTCFPSRDWFDIQKEPESRFERLDPQRTTDVLQTTKSYIQQRPSAVKTPYDLAGVITSRCSRALLDHSTDMLDFAEVYENSISDIMNEEVLLFNTFNYLMQTRTREIRVQLNEKVDTRKTDPSPAIGIVEEILALKHSKKSVGEKKQCCLKYRQYTRHTEIPDENEIKGRGIKCESEEDRVTGLIEKLARFYVLDISREVALLRQIKDIQDELEMMGKIFSDQKEALEAMNRIIHSMIQSKMDPGNDTQAGATSTKRNLREDLNNLGPEGDNDDIIHDFRKDYEWSNTVGSDITDDSSSFVGDEYLFAYERQGHLDKERQKRKDFTNQAQSEIWNFRHQKGNLPLRTVDRFADQINKMNERAKNTNSALTTLVDLKQKQSNMIDTRTARLQAEQSHKMAMESEKQGRMLMVFTIVTIVFLPLSFIAAFFAIPVKEFSNNILTLDFVSRITFPVSAATSILFIVIGFAASKWDWVRDRIDERTPVQTPRTSLLEV